MKLKYCTEDFLNEFKANFDSYAPLYLNKDREGLNKLFNDSAVLESNIEFDYQELICEGDYKETDVENAKIIYNSLKHLSPVQASQENIWVTLINTVYQDFLFYRLESEIKESNVDRLKSGTVFTQGETRSLIVHVLSRLWWLGYYTRDDRRENPYELTEFFGKTDLSGKMITFFSSVMTNNENIRLGIISGIKKLYDADLIPYKRKQFLTAIIYFNLMGGVRILDMLSFEEVEKITINLLKEENNLTDESLKKLQHT